jgi:hypothetical protein
LIYFPRRDGEARVDPLRSAVPEAVWQDILFRSEFFDRGLAPPSRVSGGGSICLHGWFYVVEATDPTPASDHSAGVRRASSEGCQPNLAMLYAIEIERAALPLFPPCARLDARLHRTPASRLAACRLLHGDRMAAAEVLNLADAFQAIGGPGDAGRLSRVLTDRSVIDWNGERHDGPNSAAFWASHAAPTLGVTNLAYRSVNGERADRVRLSGTLVRPVDTPRGRATGMETAQVEQIWTGEGGFFRVERATVGPWQAYPRVEPQ